MSGRRLGLALALGVVFALAIDVILLLSLDAIRIAPSRPQILMTVVSKSTWLVAALLYAIVSSSFRSFALEQLEWPQAFRLAGTILIVAPCVWAGATLVVFVCRITLMNAWDREGGVLLQPFYYSELVARIGPWLLAGAALKAISRHIREH